MDHAPGPRSEDPFLVALPELMAKIRDEVFYPTSTVFPRMNVMLAWGEESMWSVPYGAWELEKYLVVTSAQHLTTVKRSLDIVSMPEANHFVCPQYIYFGTFY